MKILVDYDALALDSLEDLRVPSADRSLTKRLGSGNDNGRTKTTDPLTVEMAALDMADGMRQTDVAKVYGISQESAHHYSEGKRSEHGEADKDLELNIKDRKYQIHDKAVTKLMDTLNLFDPTACEDQKEVINAATKLAGVIDKLQTKEQNNQAPVQVMIYSPRLRESKDYKEVEA